MSADRIALLLSYLQEDPGDRFSRYALGLEYFKMNELDKARDCFEHLLKHAPDYLPAYYQAGQVLVRLNRPAQAAKALRDGIVIASQQQDQHTRSELQGALLQLEDPEDG